MTAAVVALACAVAALTVIVVCQFIAIQRERSEWVMERRELIDRAIARHTGEVIALDRTHDRRHAPPALAEEPRLIEGLS